MLAKQGRENLIDFQLLTNKNYQANWHHEMVARELDHIIAHGDRDYKILMIFEPPRHGKSQQCTIDFPAYYIGRCPDDGEVIVASYSADLSQDFSVQCRDKFESPEYQTIFPGLRLNQELNTKAKWGIEQLDIHTKRWIAKKASYTAVGVGGPVTGRGAKIFLIDDPVKNRKEAESEVYRKGVWDWFTSTAFTRLEPGGVVVIVLTRWHMDDLAGRILADEKFSKMVKVISLPALATHDEEYRPKDYPLWPEKYPLGALEQIKTTVGPYDWSSLYQQTPILTENQEFKPEWRKEISEQEVERKRTRRILLVDTAMKENATADRTGFSDVRIDKDAFWYVSAWGVKHGPEDLVDMLFTLHKTNRYEIIAIEETTFTLGLKPYLDNEMRRRGVHLPIVMVKHGGTNKNVRIRGLIPYYSAGSIFHITGQCQHLTDEQDHFPFGTTDDVLDSLAYMPQVITEHMVDEETGGVHSHKPKGMAG